MTEYNYPRLIETIERLKKAYRETRLTQHISVDSNDLGFAIENLENLATEIEKTFLWR